MSTKPTLSAPTWTYISYPLPAVGTSGVSYGSCPVDTGTIPLLLSTGLGGSAPQCCTNGPNPVFRGVWGATAGGAPQGPHPPSNEPGQGPAQMTSNSPLGEEEGLPPSQNLEVEEDLPLIRDADLELVFSSLAPVPGQESSSHLGPDRAASSPSRGASSIIRAREPVEMPSHRGMQSRVKFLRMSVKALQQNLSDRLHNHPLRHQRTCPPTCEESMVSIEDELRQRFLQLSRLREEMSRLAGSGGATPSVTHH